MLQFRLSSLVTRIVRHAMDRDGEHRMTHALYLNFDIRMSSYEDVGEFKSSCGLHLLYYCPPGMTYVSVFSAVTNSPFGKLKDVTEWRHETTHDSCWRDVPIFSEVYFGMAQKINSDRVDDGLPEIAPKDMSEHNSFPLFSEELWKWVPVKISRENDKREIVVLHE